MVCSSISVLVLASALPGCRIQIAKLSTQLAISSIGEIRFNWFNFGKDRRTDEYVSAGHS